MPLVFEPHTLAPHALPATRMDAPTPRRGRVRVDTEGPRPVEAPRVKPGGRRAADGRN